MRYLLLLLALPLSNSLQAETSAQANVGQVIRDKCATDFEDDFSTQAYCIKRNTEGYEKFSEAEANSRPQLKKSYQKCAEDFGVNGDWSTAFYCANRNEEAYDDYQGLKAEVSSKLLQSFNNCEADFARSGDWSTTEYCARKQADAFRSLNR